jgi:hypothetical protein
MDTKTKQTNARLSSKSATSIAKKVGFVTYNFLTGVNSGWTHRNGRSALVIHNTNGRGSLAEGRRTRSTEEIQADIASIWGNLEKSLPELDHLVVYVGSNGSEKAIELAAKVPVEKLTFIGCSCGTTQKDEMLRAVGLGSARRFGCECGGHRTMTAMIEKHLIEGLDV